MEASRWHSRSTMEVKVLLLVVIAVAAVERVNCNATVALAAVHEMAEDPEAAKDSWDRVRKEATAWGKDKIEDGLGLEHTPRATNDDEERSTDKFQAANMAATKVKQWADKIEEGSKKASKTIRKAPEKTYETIKGATNKASSMKDAIIEKGQEVKGKVQENAKDVIDKASSMKDATIEKVQQGKGSKNQENGKVKDEEDAKHQKEVKGEKDIIGSETGDAKEMSNNKSKKVRKEERKVVEEWEEVEAKEGHDVAKKGGESLHSTEGTMSRTRHVEEL
ncbi:uncharacterized protein [Spinacia oleracea]|uniref:Uncharacterized protein n=1 Tax=Spinacia oleracea TaxID=3562 RepID=A0A9R0ICM4_SPIOL|nr:uncharacterized protein LOC110786579 [Spinacia oleracea]